MTPWATALSFGAPPVVGAAVGYLLNMVAFRGALARAVRPAAAQLLADTIARELFNSRAVGSFVQSKTVREALRSSIASVTAGLFASTSEAPTRVADTVTDLREIVRSDAVVTVVRAWLRSVVATIAGRPVRELVEATDPTDGGRDEARLRTMQASRRRLVEGLVDRLASGSAIAGAEDRSGIRDSVRRALDTAYPVLVEFLLDQLRSTPVQAELIVRGRMLIRDVVERLTTFQRIIVSAAQYDRTIDSNMPAIVGNVLEQVEESAKDPSNRSRFVDAVAAELVSAGARQERRGAVEAAKILLGGLAEAAVAAAYDRRHEPWFSSPADEREVTLGDAAERLFGLPAARFPDAIADWIVGRLQAPRDSGRPGDSGHLPEGITGFDAETKASFDLAVTDVVVKLIGSQVAGLTDPVRASEILTSFIGAVEPQTMKRLVSGLIGGGAVSVAVWGAVVGFLAGAVADVARIL